MPGLSPRIAHRRLHVLAAALGVFVLFVLVYVAPLGVRPLIAPDEPRYGEIAREMLVSGDWVVPRLNGVRYFEKPVLGHWVHAGALELLGRGAFALRLPSALAAGLTALLLFAALARRGIGVASLAAVAYLTTLQVFAIGTFTVLDTLFTLFVTAAILAFYASHRSRGGRRVLFQAGFGAACGLAFLTKGFIGLAVPGMVAVPFLLWERRPRELLTACWIPALVALAVIAPWAWSIARREPDFWTYFVWVEHVQRFLESDTRQHPQPFWFLLPYLLIGGLPWTPLLPALRRELLQEPLAKLCACWLVLPFVFFSASSGKLGTYILPCFAPLVLLVALAVSAGTQRANATLRQAGKGVAIVMGAGAAVLAFVQLTGLLPERTWGPDETWKWLLACAALLAWSALAFAGARQAAAGRLARGLYLYAAGPLLLLAASAWLTPAWVLPVKAPVVFMQAQRQHLSSDALLVTDNRLFQAASWTFERADAYMLRAGELEYGLGYADARGRLIDDAALRARIEDPKREHDLALVVRRSTFAWLAPNLPSPDSKIADEAAVFALFRPVSAAQADAAGHDPGAAIEPGLGMTRLGVGGHVDEGGAAVLD